MIDIVIDFVIGMIVGALIMFWGIKTGKGDVE